MAGAELAAEEDLGEELAAAAGLGEELAAAAALGEGLAPDLMVLLPVDGQLTLTFKFCPFTQC